MAAGPGSMLQRAGALAGRLRHGMGGADRLYVLLVIGSRGINALAMLIALKRFSPAVFGDYNYFAATVAAMTGLTTFSLENAANTLFSREHGEGKPLAPALLAVLSIGAMGMTTAAVLTGLVFGPHLAVERNNLVAYLLIWATVSAYIAAAIVNSLCYGLGKAIYSGLSLAGNVMCFAVTVLLWRGGGSGILLLSLSTTAQWLSILGQAAAIMIAGHAAFGWGQVRGAALRRQVGILFRRTFAFGARQTGVPIMTLMAGWFVQDRIVRHGGSSANGVYGVTNQIFNLVNVLPGAFAPLVLRRLAQVGDDDRRRARLALIVVGPFALLGLTATAGAYVGLLVLTPFLPPAYAGLTGLGALAALAAGAQMVKTPLSLYFTTSFRSTPDLTGAFAGATTMILGAWFIPNLNGVSASYLRLAAYGVITLIVAAWFLADRRGRAAPAPVAGEPSPALDEGGV